MHMDWKISTITVSAVYEKNANTACFDNISLIEEVAQTMKYDEEGRQPGLCDHHRVEG